MVSMRLGAAETMGGRWVSWAEVFEFLLFAHFDAVIKSDDDLGEFFLLSVSELDGSEGGEDEVFHHAL